MAVGPRVLCFSRLGVDVSRQPHQPCYRVRLEECVLFCLNFPHDQLFSSPVFQKKSSSKSVKRHSELQFAFIRM